MAKVQSLFLEDTNFCRRGGLLSGVATPGPTRAQALVKVVCALVKLFYLAQHQATWSPLLQHQN